jgi:hypothetical protein
MAAYGWTIAVSYLEWIRWIATGWLRCSDRLVWLDGPEDQEGMDGLMDCGPDLQVSDDQGFVIARLRPDFHGMAERIGGTRSFGHLSLPIVAVDSFHPLSSRGARLLEPDAERTATRLGKPIFEQLWGDWRDRRQEEETHRRGLSLCAALGLDTPSLVNIPADIRDVLTGRVASPNAAKAKESALGGTRAFGWAASLSVAFRDEAVRLEAKKSPRYLEAQSCIKDLKENFDLRRPLLVGEEVVILGSRMDELVHECGGTSLSTALMAVALHYRDIAANDRELSVRALVDDLAMLAMVDPGSAAFCAYSIGRGMESVAVTTLLYQSNPARYKALTPVSGSEELNVIRRAAAISEIEQTREDLAAVGAPKPIAPSPVSAVGSEGAQTLVDTLAAGSSNTISGDFSDPPKFSEPEDPPDLQTERKSTGLAAENIASNSGITEGTQSPLSLSTDHSAPGGKPLDSASTTVLAGDAAQTGAPAHSDLFQGDLCGTAIPMPDDRKRKGRKKK